MSGGDLELQPLPGFNERDGRTNVRADRTIAPLISSHAGLASWHVDARPRAEPEPGGIAYAVAFRGTRRVEASPSPIARTSAAGPAPCARFQSSASSLRPGARVPVSAFRT